MQMKVTAFVIAVKAYSIIVIHPQNHPQNQQQQFLFTDVRNPDSICAMQLQKNPVLLKKNIQDRDPVVFILHTEVFFIPAIQMQKQQQTPMDLNVLEIHFYINAM